jgi:hypothetical protein
MTGMSEEVIKQTKGMFADKEQSKSPDGPGFDMEGYLVRHGVKWRKETNGESVKYVLVDGCPFNQDHKGKDAAVFVWANGVLGFKCFHNECSDKHWADFRRVVSGDEDLSAFVKGGKNKANPEHGAQKPDPADPSIFVSVSDVLDIEEPNRPDLWEREIPQGSLVGFSGQWGSMKSYLLQAMGLTAAQGRYFLGRRLLEVDVFYFDLENPKSVWKRRLFDLAGQDRPKRFHMMPLFGRIAPPPFDADGVAFYNNLAKMYPEAFFIFDSLVRFYPSGKQTENTEDTIHTMTTLKKLTRFGTTVSFLHHPTKDGDPFRGGGDLQAAPDLLFTLKHNKKARRLTLECTKNRFDEGHTIEISYEPAPEGGLVFVDLATVEELKRRTEDRKHVAAVLAIIKELHPKGESTKRRLLEEGKKRLSLSRRIIDPIIDNGVNVTWTCTRTSTKHIYAPLCSDDLYTVKSENSEKPCQQEETECVQDEKLTSVHTEHAPNESVHSVYTPYKADWSLDI